MQVRVIAHIVASIKGIPIEEVAEAAYENSLRLFWPSEVSTTSASDSQPSSSS